MAMLLLNDIFERTWTNSAGQRPATEYWDVLISTVTKTHPDFLFIAEAYWDMEWVLQQRGFNFCYDKRLFDRLESDNAESVRLHLYAELAYQRKLVRFLENHDEPRAATSFSPAKERAAAVTTSTLLGTKLFHEGQFEGRKVRLPVFLGRRPVEPVDKELQAFYNKLLAAINAPIFRDGEWELCAVSGWPDNPSSQNLVAWIWVKDNDRRLIVVNLSDSAAQARVQVPWQEARGNTALLIDSISNTQFHRDGTEIVLSGLYVELEPWGYHFFQCQIE
jgi:hypothetical protein